MHDPTPTRPADTASAPQPDPLADHQPRLTLPSHARPDDREPEPGSRLRAGPGTGKIHTARRADRQHGHADPPLPPATTSARRSTARRPGGDHRSRSARRKRHGSQPRPNEEQADTRNRNPPRNQGIRHTRDRRSSPRLEHPHRPDPRPHHGAHHRAGQQQTPPNERAPAVGTNLAQPPRRHHPHHRRRPRRRRQLPSRPRRHHPPRRPRHGPWLALTTDGMLLAALVVIWVRRRPRRQIRRPAPAGATRTTQSGHTSVRSLAKYARISAETLGRWLAET